jgi:hypothetical protein
MGMIGFIDTHIFTQLGTTGNYSAIAILHTFRFTVAQALGFPVSTNRILATDLSQSHCYFKSHVVSSCHSLIPFLSLVLRLPMPLTRLHSIRLLTSSYPGRLASRNSTRLLFSTTLSRLVSFYNSSIRTTQKTQPLLLRRHVYCVVA